ncbi:unnamed protein product [Dovyalis caffra]|uniref:Uncharacterized protein n=1 Tax=Dovyalis caffra TaxID=77055 RepID=A0AAV1R2S7_9ROSI|nr:unnamed protein product [Dovyalis caffra]
MSYRREHRTSRTALFDDGLEEGGLRSSSSYSHETDDHDNDKAVHTLQDRVLFLKRHLVKFRNALCIQIANAGSNSPLHMMELGMEGYGMFDSERRLQARKLWDTVDCSAVRQVSFN